MEPKVDGRTLRRNAYYDSEEFKARWHSQETLEAIALDLDVTPRAVEKAAKRRGFEAKKKARQTSHRGPSKSVNSSKRDCQNIREGGCSRVVSSSTPSKNSPPDNTGAPLINDPLLI